VSGEIAGPLRPFHGRFAISLTVGTHFVCHHSITPFAGLHDGITSPTVVGTAVLFHKDTFCPYFDSLTNHGALPPFSMDFTFIDFTEIIEIFRSINEHKKKSYFYYSNSFWSSTNRG
jgi:hypothetical protein